MFRRKDPGLAEANLLDIRPVRTAGWKEVEPEPAAQPAADSGESPEAPAEAAEAEAGNTERGDAEPGNAEPGDRPPRIQVERALPPASGVRGWMRKLSFLTGVKTLRLDDLGSAVWRRLDGSRPVAQVIEELREEFGEGCEPAEERLGMFLGLLRRERLIGYPGWDDERIEDWKQRT